MHWSTSVSSTDESNYWQAFRNGDRQAFSALFRIHYQSIFNYGMKIIARESLVEDCIQDLFFDLWRNRESVTPNIISVRLYLMRSLRRRMLRTKDLEKRSQQAHSIASIDEDSKVHSTEWIHTENELQNQTRRILTLLIDNLPERQREVMYLRFFQELSLEEIAEIMAINKQSVKNMIYRSVISLRSNPTIAQIFYSIALLASLLVACL